MLVMSLKEMGDAKLEPRILILVGKYSKRR
jgi:hypothetical protein